MGLRVSGSHCVRMHVCAFVCFCLRVFVHVLSYVCFLQLKSDTDFSYGKRHSFLGGGFGLGENIVTLSVEAKCSIVFYMKIIVELLI